MDVWLYAATAGGGAGLPDRGLKALGLTGDQCPRQLMNAPHPLPLKTTPHPPPPPNHLPTWFCHYWGWVGILLFWVDCQRHSGIPSMGLGSSSQTVAICWQPRQSTPNKRLLSWPHGSKTTLVSLASSASSCRRTR